MTGRRHFRTCSLCEAMCGLAIDVQDDVVTAIRGDADDVFSRGHVCPKAVALKDVHEDPDRLRRPLVREGTGWREAGWDEALETAARGIAAVQRAHGRSAVALYQGNPSVHNYGTVLAGQLLARTLRSRSLFSATSVDQLPHMLASLLMFGHQLLLPVPDLDRTDFLLILGANPVASNGSLMTAPGVERRLREIRARGGRIVVVDPRRTETAAAADQHVPIRPGTDAWLLLAMVQTLFAEGRIARASRALGLSDGLAQLEAACAPFTPEAVSARTGIAPDATRDLARALADAPRAAAYGRVGVSTQEFGGLSCWLINVLNVLTGRLDEPGGAMFPRPAVDLVALAARLGQRGHFDRRRSRVRGLPEFGGELPVAVLAEEIETAGEGQVRGLVVSSGNPVLSTPDGARLARALGGLEFMVSIDPYLNETSRHAQVVLPPVGPLERDHYDLIFHIFGVRNTAKYSPPLFAPPAEGRQDFDILLDLSRRLARAKGRYGLASRLTHAAMAALGPRGVLALLLRTGPYGAGFRPFARGLTLRRLERAPHGVDLGPLDSRLPEALGTPDRRIALAPAPLLADLARLAARADEPGLRLIGRRDLRSNNSWMHNSTRLVKGPARCTLLMHPQDAAARGLAGGETVTVRSRVGAVEVPLEVTDAMMPGAVSLPHGWGHGREGTRLAVANAHPGASHNDLTDALAVDALAGTAAFSGTPVEVTAVRPG